MVTSQCTALILRKSMCVCWVGCVLLVLAHRACAVERYDARSRNPRLLVVLIGGMDSDPTPAQLAGTAVRQQGNSGMYQLAGDLSEDTYLPVYFNWNGSRAGELRRPGAPGTVEIARFIRGHVQAFPRDRVAIVGNSWGGQSAVEVLRALREDESPLAVQLVVLLDAASAGRGAGPPKALPENIARIIQYRTRNVFVWGELPPDRRLTTIDLGNPEAGFMRDGRPAYHAPFDFRAHVAAEWDEKIHDDIKQRLAAESAGLIIAGK